jgi:hypothetical protein
MLPECRELLIGSAFEFVVGAMITPLAMMFSDFPALGI